MDSQLDALEEAGCDRVYEEEISDAAAKHPNLVSSQSQQYFGFGGSSSYQPGPASETGSEPERCLHSVLLRLS